MRKAANMTSKLCGLNHWTVYCSLEVHRNCVCICCGIRQLIAWAGLVYVHMRLLHNSLHLSNNI